MYILHRIVWWAVIAILAICAWSLLGCQTQTINDPAQALYMSDCDDDNWGECA